MLNGPGFEATSCHHHFTKYRQTTVMRRASESLIRRHIAVSRCVSDKTHDFNHDVRDASILAIVVDPTLYMTDNTDSTDDGLSHAKISFTYSYSSH